MFHVKHSALKFCKRAVVLEFKDFNTHRQKKHPFAYAQNYRRPPVYSQESCYNAYEPTSRYEPIKHQQNTAAQVNKCTTYKKGGEKKNKEYRLPTAIPRTFGVQAGR
jgi:hypothetical protein